MHPFRLACALVFLAAVAGAAPARAQFSEALQKSTPAERAAIQTRMMKERLALSDAQVPKIEAINLDTAQKMEPLIKGSEGPLVKARQARALEAAKEGQLQTVLSQEQFMKYVQMQAEMRQKLEDELAKKAAGGAP